MLQQRQARKKKKSRRVPWIDIRPGKPGQEIKLGFSQKTAVRLHLGSLKTNLSGLSGTGGHRNQGISTQRVKVSVDIVKAQERTK